MNGSLHQASRKGFMSSISKTILKNSASIAVADLIIRLVSFVFNIFVIRQLGGAEFGRYATVMAYVGIFAIFSDMGMATYATREIAQDKSKTAFLTWNTILFRVVLSFVAIPLITLVAIKLGYSQETVLGILVASSALILHAVYGPVNNLVRGYERMDLRGASQVVERVVFVLFGTVVLLYGLNFIWLIVGTQISVIAAAIVGIFFVVRYIGWFRFEVSPNRWGELLVASLPFGIITLTMMVADRIDTIILSLWTEDIVVGWYNAAYGFMINLLFFSDTLNGALGPTLARTYSGSKQAVVQVYQTSFRLLFVVSLPIAVGGTILADKIIPLLYTEEFLPAVPAFQVLIWALPLVSLHKLCSAMATASHQEKDQARIRVAAALVNIAINFVAIPRYGLMGAAVVTVLTELMVFVLMFRLVNNQFKLQSGLKIIVKPILAVGSMAVVVLLGHSYNLFLVIGSGALVYGLALLATKAIDLQDPDSHEAILLRTIGRRLRARTGGAL